jgi:hypothetical protein
MVCLLLVLQLIEKEEITDGESGFMESEFRIDLFEQFFYFYDILYIGSHVTRFCP